ncbi:MAG: DNA gyrase subunit B [Planctomycetes bacterium]|nr:DNA gyrase subunit B [Planctomycetota bacterium]
MQEVPAAAQASADDYSASAIEILEGLEAVRRRPGMYIGNPEGQGLYQLVWEVVDNAIDEALAGYCTEVTVTIHGDGALSVTDNGRGIPVEEHPEMPGKSALEVALTVLHAGGKFKSGVYKKSGGLHGVGVSCVNAVSEWLVVDVHRGGRHYRMRFARGEPQGPLTVVGDSAARGTTVRFKPDPLIFGANTVFDWDVIASRLRELAFLNPKVRIVLIDERTEGRSEVFWSTDGLAGFVRLLNQGKEVLHEIVHFKAELQKPLELDIEVAWQYHDGYDEHVLCFANNIRNRDGGTHLEAFRATLTRVMNGYAREHGLLKGETAPSGEDWREGLTAIVSVKLPQPSFSNQTKDKLITDAIQAPLSSCFGEQLREHLERHPRFAQLLVQRALQAAEGREAARRAREAIRRRKNLLTASSLPDKLRDCQSHSLEESELFIVEGDSAGGSAKRGSDARFQAILPLKGKVINAEKARAHRVFEHADLAALITAIGTSVGEDFNLGNLRYGKIVIMTDADHDGSHIRTLLLVFFFRHLPQLIEHGRLWIAQPPLYKVKRGRHTEYVYDGRRLEQEIVRLGSNDAALLDSRGQRELSAQQLQDLLAVVSALLEHERSLAFKDLTLREYLALRDADGTLPLYQLRCKETIRFLADSAALDAALATVREEGAEPPEIIEFVERAAIERDLQRLAALGYQAEDLDDRPGDAARFLIRDAKEERQVAGLRAVLAAVREFGSRGMDIQRYKGLGEMNPEELWETTLDPARRSLKRVTIGDAVEAERVFSILMGERVAPRRAYIERHALAVSHRIDV